MGLWSRVFPIMRLAGEDEMSRYMVEFRPVSWLPAEAVLQKQLFLLLLLFFILTG